MRAAFHAAAVLACLAGAVGSVYHASIAPKAEPLVADRMSRHLGSIRQGEEGLAIFHLRNDSRSGVEILAVEPTCGCIAVVVGNRRLGPGESTTLTATLHADASRGLKTTRIDIRYRPAGETAELNLALELSADVTPHYDVRPAVLKFDPRHRERTITLSPNFDPKIEILSASCPHPAFEVSPKGQTVRVRFDPARWADDFARPRLMLRTTSPYQPRHEVVLDVEVQPGFSNPGEDST